MSNKSMTCCSSSSSCMLLPLLLLLLLPAMLDGATATATRRARIAASSNSISNNNEPLTEPKQAAETTSKATTTTTTTSTTTTATAAGKLKTSADSKYEIRGVAGEPNYKSVNLTWEVEFVTLSPDTDTSSNNNNNNNINNNNNSKKNVNGSLDVDVTNMSDDLEPPKAFQIFYCEMQNYGPQRCRVKLVNSTSAELPQTEDADTQVQHFAAAVDNLRMATRYSFHIRPAQQRRLRSSSARADFHEDNEIESGVAASRSGEHLPGQSIIIPTKGFSAHATQCLAHASEIEVETGPYFGGRIVVDGGNCGIKGNANDPADKYTMRIDHKLCGSMVKPETNTVETFITVQENLGIFTHSTRRFVVVCSYQSGIQTVRASFTVPGKNAGVAAAVEPNDPFQPDDERLGRELRHMRFVNKSELVLREPDSDSEAEAEEETVTESAEQAALVRETIAPAAETQLQLEDVAEPLKPQTAKRQQGRALSLTSLNELNNLAHVDVEAPAQGRQLDELSTKYAKLVVDHGNNGATWTSARAKADDANDDEFYAASLRYISANLGGVLVTVSISVIIISICIVLLQRQRLRPKSCNNNKRQSHLASAHSNCHTTAAHLPHKTLPRALQHQQYQCTL